MSSLLPRRRLVALGGVVSLLVARTAAGQTAAEAAPIAALNEALLRIMRAGRATPFATRAAMLAPVIEAAFDLLQILKTSVGMRWATLPSGQRTELLETFRRYTVASYVANFDGFSGERFEIVPGSRAVGADRVVASRIVPVGDAPTRIDYVMRETGGAWKVIDVLLDGSISRVAVQRSDFRALLASGDPAMLIASLAGKAVSLETGGAP